MLNGCRAWVFKVCVAGVLLTLAAVPARALAAEPFHFRIFLQDGSTLVSYGEFARVADRVVFSIPMGASDGSDLQLVSLPESLVDWPKTDEYTQAVRAAQFAATHGPNHFAMLGNRVTEALGDIRLTPDATRQLAMAEEARRNLARWPVENFGYRADDVTRMVDMFDEVISELRIAAGEPGFELRLSANTSPAPPVALLPAPGRRDAIAQAVTLARLAGEPAERMSLLQAVAAALKEPARSEADAWAVALQRQVTADLAAELRVERQYQDLMTRTAAAAASRAARADVRGIQTLTRDTLQADDRLGRRRPHEIAALLGYLDLKLEEARSVRMARAIWAARRELFEEYRQAIRSPLEQLRQSRAWLTAVRDGRGPGSVTLDRQAQRTVMARRVFELVPPPAELDTAHSLYVAAFHMARRAASTRRDAVSSTDAASGATLARDASSAAAGSLMMLAQADEDLARLMTSTSPNR